MLPTARQLQRLVSIPAMLVLDAYEEKAYEAATPTIMPTGLAANEARTPQRTALALSDPDCRRSDVTTPPVPAGMPPIPANMRKDARGVSCPPLPARTPGPERTIAPSALSEPTTRHQMNTTPLGPRRA